MNTYGFDDDMFGDQNKKKNLDEEIRRFREALRKGEVSNGQYTPSVESLEELVQYCIDTEKYEDALNFCSLWLEFVPYSSDAWQSKGFILNALTRYSEALEAYDTALTLNPVDADIIIHRAITLDNLNRKDEALGALSRILGLAPQGCPQPAPSSGYRGDGRAAPS